MSNNIKSEGLIFWVNNVPHLDFVKTKFITWNGTNVMQLRDDIDTEIVWLFIYTFYRLLTPKSLVEKIKTCSAADLRNLRVKTGEAAVLTNQFGTTNGLKASIPFHYDTTRAIFKRPNTLKTLAFLILSKKYPRQNIPIDLEGAKTFFQENFKDDIDKVFDDCCKCLQRNSKEVLEYYEINLSFKIASPFDSYKPQKKKNSTLNAFCSAFLRIV